MTVIAFDGARLCADSLTVDNWGSKSLYKEKIKEGKNFVWAGAGDISSLLAWEKTIRDKTWQEIVEEGYLPYEREHNDPSILLIGFTGKVSQPHVIYTHEAGQFMPRIEPIAAIGSGSQYAIGVMACGRPADVAVRIACDYDVHCGGSIICYDVREKTHQIMLGGK